MDWQMLKENKCPRCHHSMSLAPLDKNILICTSNNCAFYLTVQSAEIIKKVKTKEDMVTYMKRRAGLIKANPHYAARMEAIKEQQRIERMIAQSTVDEFE